MIRSSSIVLAGILATGASAGSILIQNPGFEDPPLEACAFNSQIAGWAVVSGGVWRPLPCWSADYPQGAPEGLQVGYSNGGDIAQVLAATLEALQEYTLLVDVGRRGSCCPMQDYKVQLLAGGMLLAEDPGLLDPAPGTFQTSTISFVAGTNHPALGQPLEIRLVRVGGGQANFDDVRLFTGLADCNRNGVHDAIDIALGTSDDKNGNGLPDECDQPPTCPEDLNGDGDVGGADLGQLLLVWETDDDQADLNNDGAVNGADLGALLLAWGSC